MSKIKKERPSAQPSGISEIDIKFVKLIKMSGWIFLLALGIFLGIWGLFDQLLKLMDIPSDSPMVFVYVIFTGGSSFFSFALGTKLDKQLEDKRKIFFDWMITEFLFCMFCIFSLAVYQW